MDHIITIIESIQESTIRSAIAEGYLAIFEGKYEVKHIEAGKQPVKTDIPPEKRSLKNRPRFSTGKQKVDFREWLGMDITTGSVGKGTDGKWYGWSHRAVHGFGIGDKVKKGDCAYDGKEYTIDTDEQAHETAIRFADSVS